MDHRRRCFLHASLRASGVILLGSYALSALAQQKPLLAPSDYQARALNYVEDAADATDEPEYANGRHCGNCSFFTESNQNCGLFPDKRVRAAGWCSGWTAR